MSPRSELDLKARVLAATARSPSRSRPRGRARAAAIYGLAAAAAATGFQLYGGVAHSSGRPLAVSAGLLAGAVVLALAASALGLVRGRSMTGRTSLALGLVALLAPAAILAWLPLWHGRYVEPFERIGWRCFGLTLVLGAVLLGAILVVRKGSDPVHPTAHGAAAGACAGVWAGVLVDAWCPLTGAPHVALGHALPVLLLGVVGAAAGRVLLAPRRV